MTSTLLLIVGCSITPNSMRTNSLDAVHSSVKTPQAIALCVAAKWEGFGVVNQRKISDGISLIASLSGNLHYLVDITSKGTDSVTKAYKFMSISIGVDPYFKAMSNCQI